ncbi:transporter [Sorangium cellulosum]|uniref:Transporter n=1 Tax=Sorangium cellulosum TaxID=56 RepID=A0A2L0EUS0_SORCE|nr:RDD family protein [Sorangium cellulosum]AUX43044.1 transporter [Sorangium cellulosum]
MALSRPAPLRQRPEAPLDTSAEIETPEHVRFSYRIAGPARRGLAYAVDLLLRGLVMSLLGAIALIAGYSMGTELGQASIGILLLVFFVLEWGYFVFWEFVWNGQSPGKRAVGLRVVSLTGQPLQFHDSVLRNLLRAADFLPSAYALGALVMGLDSRFRRLGDLVAGTMVIAEARHRVTEPVRVIPAPSAKELSRLPQRLPLSGEDRDALELFLRRAPQLSAARAAELAEMAAPLYARRIGVRYKDPQRFLQLLYCRAHEKK